MHNSGWWDRAGQKILDKRIATRSAFEEMGGQILKKDTVQVEGGYMKQSRPHE